ncbi:hypothetical protein ES332_D13G145700v1 [Gossypium tomentosum]|uniref:Complex 1 LYR protein domain-containing protein n=1 Tax=Gossypium tomentosum TaxID=34277 RepID=A0A5D2HXI1_GOSTO|nr:hypothetical protein ES332_D13G145700v1 [Gossypium tomentosum]
MGASKGQKLSGMQRQVLSLYRGFLRAARSKPTEDRRQIESIVSAEFHQNSKQVDRKNFLYIEYLLRRGLLGGKGIPTKGFLCRSRGCECA